jgi:hypothetical protein
MIAVLAAPLNQQVLDEWAGIIAADAIRSSLLGCLRGSETLTRKREHDERPELPTEKVFEKFGSSINAIPASNWLLVRKPSSRRWHSSRSVMRSPGHVVRFVSRMCG